MGYGAGYGAPGFGFCGVPVNNGNGVGFVNTGGIGFVNTGVGFVNTGGIGFVNTGGVGLVPINSGVGSVILVTNGNGTGNGGIGLGAGGFDDLTKLVPLVKAVLNNGQTPPTTTNDALTSIAKDFHTYVQIRYEEARKNGADVSKITYPK